MAALNDYDEEIRDLDSEQEYLRNQNS